MATAALDTKIIAVQKEGNPNWPLPSNYEKLSREQQRMARVNACRQWMLDGTEEERAENLIASVKAFDLLYLQADKGYFYPPFQFRDSPRFHDDILEGIAIYKYNVIAAPRGHAKSFLMRKMMLLLLTSCPMFSITYCAASDKLVKKTVAAMVRVWRNNALLFEDWAPEYGGRLVPVKGHSPFGLSGELHLSNHAILFATSAKAKNRGDRPHLVILDDIEFDAAASTDMELRREDVASFLFSVILPMVLQEGSKVVWIGTTISKRHFLYQAVAPTVALADRPSEFKTWHRMFFKSLYELEDGTIKPLWPENYSEERLTAFRKAIGEGRFRAEMMNDPDSDGSFTFDLKEEAQNYELYDIDEFTYKDPLVTRAMIRYNDPKGNLVEKPFGEFIRESWVVLTIDWANSAEATSDYSALVVSAFTPDNQLFVLDVFAGKITTNYIALQALKMARKWETKIVGVESPNISFHMTHAIRTKFQEAGPGKDGFYPKIQIIKTYKQSKADRIESLQWRFPSGLLKLPFALKSQDTWRMLFNQITGFRAQAPNGGLTHDDILDALAMAQDENITPGLKSRRAEQGPPEKPDIQRAMEGELFDKDGRRLLEGIQISKLPTDVLDTIMAKQREKIALREKVSSAQQYDLSWWEDQEELSHNVI